MAAILPTDPGEYNDPARFRAGSSHSKKNS